MRVLNLAALRARHPRALAVLDAQTRKLGRQLAQLALKRVLVVASCPRHTQSTQWWYEQALLSLLVAADIEVTFVTDGWFEYDLDRMRSLGRVPTMIEGEPARVPAGSFDAVIAMPPSDLAIRVAAERNVPLVACMTKNHEVGAPTLTYPPPHGTPLWHAFARSEGFAAAQGFFVGETRDRWVPMGAPFPVNRYYSPPTDAVPTRHVLLLGTNARDVALAFAASRGAGESRIAVLGNHADRERVMQLAAAHGVAVDWSAQLGHDDMMALIASSSVVINPITTESHYSLSLPLAIGRPVLATESTSASVFYDPARSGMRLLPPGSVAVWADAIRALRDPVTWRRASDDAAARAASHHDAERFFASAIASTLRPTL